MTSAAPENANAKPEPAAAPPTAKKFGGKRIKLIAIVLVLMTVPAIGAALLLPKGHTTSTGEAAENGHPSEDAHSAEKSTEGLVEVEIGSFSVTIELEDGMLWNVSFKLYATVGPAERSHFEEAVTERYKARVRQAVNKVVRRSNINDLRDPQLDLLKRNLKTEVNNVLPERYVREIIVTEIRTMQQ